MKTYRGWRTGAGTEVTVTDRTGSRPLDPRLDLHRLSAAGFQWGHGDSSTAQLALALTADALGDDDRARGVYQRFKIQLVRALPADSWTLTEHQIRAAIADIERVQARLARPGSDGRADEGRPR